MSTRFIHKEKLSKKARRELNAARRTLWVVSPVSKKVESKKVYNRKKSARLYRDDTGRIFDLAHSAAAMLQTDKPLFHLLLAVLTDLVVFKIAVSL